MRWFKYEDNEKRTFYYCPETKTSQYDEPPQMRPKILSVEPFTAGWQKVNTVEGSFYFNGSVSTWEEPVCKKTAAYHYDSDDERAYLALLERLKVTRFDYFSRFLGAGNQKVPPDVREKWFNQYCKEKSLGGKRQAS